MALALAQEAEQDEGKRRAGNVVAWKSSQREARTKGPADLHINSHKCKVIAISM